MRKSVARPADGDLVGELLRDLRIDSSVLCRSVMARPWGFGVAARDVGSFHMLLDGHGWLEADGVDGRVELGAGDLVVLPGGTAHRLRDAPSTATPSLTSILEHHEVVDGELRFGGHDGPPTEIVCGVFRTEGVGWERRARQLPPVIRSADASGDGWRRAVGVALRDEARSPTSGGSAIVNRLLESLLADALRGALVARLRDGTEPANGTGDPRIGRVLARIHERPEARWSVQRLAGVAVMSRSAFSPRFRALVGTPPMRYVTEVRLELARRSLQTTDRTVAEIARRVGYASESALSRALKARFGESPSGLRRRATASDVVERV